MHLPGPPNTVELDLLSGQGSVVGQVGQCNMGSQYLFSGGEHVKGVTRVGDIMSRIVGSIADLDI